MTKAQTRDKPTRSTPRNLREEIGKKNPFDHPSVEAYLNLVRTADCLSRDVREIFAAHSLSEPLYNALRIIAARGPSGIRSQSIASDMVTRDPDMTRLVDRLVRAGLATRKRSEDDRRAVCVAITPAGRAIVKKLEKPLLRQHQEHFAHLSDDEMARLNRLLFKARHPDQ